MKRVLVTGANGFIGRRLCAHLAGHGWNVIAAVRSAGAAPPELAGCKLFPGATLDAVQGWADAVKGVDAIAHLAARVHVMNDADPDPLAAHRSVNCRGTLELARLAAGLGVKRFVFLSTVKVNGERTLSAPFTEADAPAPADPYAVSKWEAEQGLSAIAAATGLEVASVRAPLVYGPWVKGNFLRLMGLVRRRLPLPLASVANARSFAYVGNLASALERTLSAPLSGPATFLVSDDHDLSTPELLRGIGAAMGVSPRLVPFPPRLLLAAGRLIGKGDEARRMLESLRVDCARIKRELDWYPPYSTARGIADAVAWFQRIEPSSAMTPG